MLRCQHNDPPFFLDGDESVNARTVQSLVKRGAIALAGDGLFDGDGQTYVLVNS